MHRIIFRPDGQHQRATYPRTVCDLKLGEDRFHYCGPRFLAEHCARLGIEPCTVCWAPPAGQLGLDLGSVPA